VQFYYPSWPGEYKNTSMSLEQGLLIDQVWFPIQTAPPVPHNNKTAAYQKSIATNAQNNRTKKELIEVSQWFFVITMLCITIFSIWLLIYPIKFPS
jgi:hypothetical protein